MWRYHNTELFLDMATPFFFEFAAQGCGKHLIFKRTPLSSLMSISDRHAVRRERDDREERLQADGSHEYEERD